MDERTTKYLTVRETAKRLGVHENTVRNWVNHGLLRSARIPGARFHRFEIEEVERLAMKRDAASGSVGGSRSLIGPDLVTATQLSTWAGNLQANGLFPQLMRRLLEASPKVTQLSLRAGEGIAGGGWDARVRASRGSLRVPAGDSGWELSTYGRVRQKAEEDYWKRTEDPLGFDPEKTAFVFATPRRWLDAEAWERERRADGVWRDVRVVDADVLEAWLEATPAVHYWISEVLGLQPRNAITLGRWWQEFAGRTRPRLPSALILAGREQQLKQLAEFLRAAPTSTGLQASSRAEAIAVVAAALEADSELRRKGATGIVVSAPQVWDRLVSSSAPMLLIPDFDDPDIAGAVAGGHHVVTPLGWQDVPRGGVVRLPRPDRRPAEEAFREAGLSFDKSNHYAALARRSLAALMRRLAANPRVARPEWAYGQEASIFASLLLVGGWSAWDADREVAAKVVGAEWAEIERHLLRWARTDDPPFTASNGGWHMTSPEEAYEVLSSLIPDAAHERWAEAVAQVLGETDPSLDLSEQEKLAASLDGSGMAYSGTLRRGLAESMALLGAFGVDAPAAVTLADRVRRMVRELLGRANDDESGLLWRSLADELPRLAEAGPEEFLTAVEAGLSGKRPVLLTMFQDSHRQSPIGSSSPHTGLLWALETVCWSSEHFAEALLALARLAEIDPGGSLGNRPSASLRAVLLPWVPYTGASVDQRLAALAQVRCKYPDVGWHLLISLLPKHQDWSSPTSSPRFRDWKPDREGVTIAEWTITIAGLVDQALEDLENDPTRWRELVEHIAALPPDERDRLLDNLENVELADVLDAEQCQSLWRVITEHAAHHREFPSAQWSMDDRSLSRLEAVAAALAPQDVVVLSADLFGWRPTLPSLKPTDHPAYDEALAKARRDAARRVLDSLGLEGVRRLATESPQPGFAGWAVAEVAGDELTAELLRWLDQQDALGELAGSWARRMAQDSAWVAAAAKRVGDLTVDGRAAFLRAVPPGDDLARLLNEAEPAVQEAYWRTINSFVFLDPEHIAFGVEGLVAHRRAFDAIDLLATRLHDSEPLPPDITAEVIVVTLQAGLSTKPEDVAGVVSIDYEVGVLLRKLEQLRADDKVLVQLEWAYFPVLEHSGYDFRALFTALGNEPRFFVDLVSAVYRGTHEQNREPDHDSVARARNAWSVLDAWRRLPGTRHDGSIDRDRLRKWVNEARLELAERDRTDIGDERIGQMLSGSPIGSDGAWPTEPVRDIIEDIGSRELETGLHIGKRNSRGVTSRGVYDGGNQERDLAARFSEWAATTGARWPRTTRVLRELADSYEREAKRMDAEAEAWANRG